MTLKDNIMRAITTLGDEIQKKALAAMAAGQGDPATGKITPEWESFMKLFVGDPINKDHLARLLPTDGTHKDVKMQRERVYLVGNSTCGATTTETTFDGGVTEALDKDLQRY